MSDITIVTAFFDIGRTEWTGVVNGRQLPHYIPRSTDTYFSYFENLSKIKNDMVIFTSNDLVEKIKAIRDKNAPNSVTHVVGVNLADSTKAIKPIIQMVQSQPEYADLMVDPHMPEYWNADYVLVNFMKTDFVNHAYDVGLITTELAAWIDFGYARDDKTIPDNGVWKYSFDPKKMHYFNKIPLDTRPIFDITRTNTVYIMGCHIVGGKDAWTKHQKYTYDTFVSLVRCGLIDDDQTVMLMNYRMNPNDFELHPITVNREEWDEWNVAMIKFNKI
jgi:protein YibB